jgi:hypothetical protein
MATAAAPRRSSLPGYLGRLRRLSAAEIGLLAEAFVVLAASSAAIRALPFARVGRLASWRLGNGRPGPSDQLAGGVAWAVKACARRAPWRAVCFQQGLAAQIMLRRRGVDSTLFFGAAIGEDLTAHVWVKAGERDVVGCEEAPGYAVLATFPPRSGAFAPKDASREPIKFDSIRS